MNQTCKSCKWYAEFEGVCCNGDSEHCADFIDADKSCGEWEIAKAINNAQEFIEYIELCKGRKLTQNEKNYARCNYLVFCKDDLKKACEVCGVPYKYERKGKS